MNIPSVSISCIADLHGHYPKLEGGDLLIVAGDLTSTDDPIEYTAFRDWLNEQEYEKKIVVPGNHDGEIELDWTFQSESFHEIAEILIDRGIEFRGFKIWGSPWTLQFAGMNPKFRAFTLESEGELKKKFELIPEGVDILVTHAAPYGIRDGTSFADKPSEETKVTHLGSRALKDRLEELGSGRDFLHVFGHVHEGYGVSHIDSNLYVNASHVNLFHKPVNAPIRVNR